MRSVVPIAGFTLAFLTISAALRAQTPPLRAVHPVVSQSDDGPALQGGEAFMPGEQVFFSFQTEGYKTGTTGKVQLTAHIEAFDPKGTLIAPSDEVMIGTTTSQEDKEWKPKLRSQLQLPSIAPPGDYKIKFDVTDLQTKQKASGEVTFPVHGRAVESSAQLAVRGLRFYRTQDDENPLRIAAYRPGDVMWVKFDVTGFKHGEQNSIDVSYDVSVLKADGTALFSQDAAAVERSQAFYPQPWVPAEFNLNLQSTMTPGPYTLVITAHDGVAAGQTIAAKSEFRIEQ
ncbi:MAG TPA: hypothetical protein VG273_06075 [Bryobacteraceae bacterium]|jgi:hypothetical protein|nr:hypothetical protein [Bryobacteraceae bacterium]